MCICADRTGIVGGKGWNGVISNHVFPQLLKDRLCRRAVGSNFIHDLVFISGAKLPVGNQPNEDLGGNVFIHGAPPYLVPVSTLYPKVRAVLIIAFCSVVRAA